MNPMISAASVIAAGLAVGLASIGPGVDAIASIRLILNKLVFTICEGRSSYIINP